MDWFGKLLALPECYLSCSGTGGGVIQGAAGPLTTLRPAACWLFSSPYQVWQRL